MLLDALDPVYFGKLPSRGDFVRYNANRPSVRALDAWIQRGLYEAKRWPGPFEAAYDSASACGFFFSPSEVPGALIGVMHPSRDRGGRRYPFFIALDAGGRRFRSEQVVRVPVEGQTFMARAHTLAEGAVSGRMDLRTVTDRLEASACLQPANAGYERFLQQTTLQNLWEQLWGRSDDDRQTFVMRNLLDILLPLRRRIPVRFSLGLHFPLLPGEVGTYVASFWWEVCFRLLRFPRAVPTCFWTVTKDGEASHPSLLFFLRPPTASVLSHLVGNGREESDHICVMDRRSDQRATQGQRRITSRYSTLINNERLTLKDFLHRLS